MRFLTKSLLAMALMLGCALPAAQAAYPEKPINMVIAFTAGGSSDVQARLMQKYWNKYCDKAPWVFVYKPGAGGKIGFTEIARSKADGQTIGGINVPHCIFQSLEASAQYDARKDFTWICQVVNDPQVVAVRKDSKYNTLQELLDAVKANPGKMKLGMSGPKTGQHLMMLDMQKKYPEYKFAPVWYKGAADQNVALLGGEIDVAFGNLNDLMRAKDETRILAIASEQPNKTFIPDVPTMKSLGYDIVSDIRRGFVAPAGLSADQVKALREIFKKIGTDPEYRAEMIKGGQPEEYMDGEEFQAWMTDQFAKSEALLKGAGIIK
ncbi:MAG: tripartite tricarboxylate transporter substrate binding protein [Mailhella sp.]|nr:tripartite tricarboxylate transporter substrate binding protein [Mailhella sp.]